MFIAVRVYIYIRLPLMSLMHILKTDEGQKISITLEILFFQLLGIWTSNYCIGNVETEMMVWSYLERSSKLIKNIHVPLWMWPHLLDWSRTLSIAIGAPFAPKTCFALLRAAQIGLSRRCRCFKASRLRPPSHLPTHMPSQPGCPGTNHSSCGSLRLQEIPSMCYTLTWAARYNKKSFTYSRSRFGLHRSWKRKFSILPDLTQTQRWTRLDPTANFHRSHA
jgi:hypothetical protein